MHVGPVDEDAVADPRLLVEGHAREDGGEVVVDRRHRVSGYGSSLREDRVVILQVLRREVGIRSRRIGAQMDTAGRVPRFDLRYVRLGENEVHEKSCIVLL